MTLTLIVSETEKETDLVQVMALSPKDGGALPGFEAGAHINVHVPGLSEPRSYSLIDLAANQSPPDSYRIAVRLEAEGGGGSRFMHDLALGDEILVDPPANHFPLESSDLAPILIAGGIGITPLASMANALTRDGRSFDLHYSGRNADSLALVPALTALCGPALHLHHDDDPATALDLPALLATLDSARPIYVCGPAGMIDATLDIATGLGWSRDDIHFEHFALSADLLQGDAFEVELASTGQIFAVPADKTIVDVLVEAGIDVLYDCRRGDCGICQCTVIEGIPDHRDFVLTDAERASNSVMQICISRSKSPRLLLDL